MGLETLSVRGEVQANTFPRHAGSSFYAIRYGSTILLAIPMDAPALKSVI